MKVRSECDANNIRIQYVEGVVVLKELLLFLKDVYTSENFDSEQSSIWDFTKANLIGFDSRNIETLKEFVSDYWGVEGRARSALIVSNDTNFDVSNIYEQMMEASSNSPIRVFLDWESAYEWVTESN